MNYSVILIVVGIFMLFAPKIWEFVQSKVDLTPKPVTKSVPVTQVQVKDRQCILDETLELVKRLPADSKNREIIINKIIPELVNQELNNET